MKLDGVGLFVDDMRLWFAFTKAVMDYFFEKVEANRIESRHDPRNPYSGKVMEKCGMKYEGTLKSADWNNQGICDACYYALLKSER